MSSSLNFRPSSRSNACPVCGKINGNCRQGKKDEKYWQCMSYAGTAKGDTINGYVCYGDTVNGLWGQFREYDENAQRKYDFEKQRQRKAKEKSRDEQEWAEEKRRSLSAIARNSLYNKLKAQLSLEQWVIEELESRGFTPEEIEGFEAVSFTAKQPLTEPLDPRLSGIDGTGRRLAVEHPGFTCWAMDINGRKLGYQVKFRYPEVAGGKYKWSAGRGIKQIFPEGGRPDGELPLSIRRPLKGKALKVALCEGIGIKPYLLANRQEVLAMGASSAQHASSPGLFIESLKVALKEVAENGGDGEAVYYYPDAGAVANSNIMNQIRRAVELINDELGCSVKVGWWGQTTKEHFDVDELPPGTKVEEFISFQKFEAIAAPYLEQSAIVPASIKPRKQARANQPDFEEECGLADEAIAIDRIQNPPDLQSLLSRLTRQKKKKASKRTLAPPVRPKKQELVYTGGRIPTPRELHQRGQSEAVITFEEGQRREVLKSLVRQGHQDYLNFFESDSPIRPKGHPRYIVESSDPGQGKSHDAGLMQVESFDRLDKIFYVSNNHKNPDTKTVEANFSQMPTRNNGLLEDESRRSPMGNPHRRSPNKAKGEVANITGNCLHSHHFNRLAAKNFSSSCGKGSSVCGRCPGNAPDENGIPICVSGSGENIGYRGEAARTFKLPHVACHPDQLPSLAYSKPTGNEGAEEGDEEESGDKGAVLLYDEFSTFNWVKTLDISADDILRAFERIAVEDEETYLGLIPLKKWLYPRVSGAEKTGKDGLLDSEIKKACIPLLPNNTDHIFKLVTDQEDKEERELSKAIKSKDEGMEKTIERAIPQFMRYLFAGLTGRQSVGMRIKGGTLQLFVRNERLLESTKEAAVSILMDATPPPRNILAQMLECESWEIMEVRQRSNSYTNLEFIQIKSLGQMGGDRSPSLIKKHEALLAGLRERHPGLKSIDKKAYAEGRKNPDDQMWWFNHHRGTNEAENCEALAISGIPYPNIGDLASEYTTLTGQIVELGDTGLNEFLQWKVQADFIQAVGRVRAHRRPGQKIPVYLVNDYPLDFLLDAFPGATLKQEEAINIAWDAGTGREKALRLLPSAIAKVAQTVRSAEDVSQTLVAKAMGVAQGTVSKLTGGLWKEFVEAVLGGFAEPKLSPEAQEEAAAIAHDILPLITNPELAGVSRGTTDDLIEGLTETRRAYGAETFAAGLAIASQEVQAEVLSAMLECLSCEAKQNLVESVGVDSVTQDKQIVSTAENIPSAIKGSNSIWNISENAAENQAEQPSGLIPKNSSDSSNDIDAASAESLESEIIPQDNQIVSTDENIPSTIKGSTSTWNILGNVTETQADQTPGSLSETDSELIQALEGCWGAEELEAIAANIHVGSTIEEREAYLNRVILACEPQQATLLLGWLQDFVHSLRGRWMTSLVIHGADAPQPQTLVTLLNGLETEEEFLAAAIAISVGSTSAGRMEALVEAIADCVESKIEQLCRWLDRHQLRLAESWSTG